MGVEKLVEQWRSFNLNRRGITRFKTLKTIAAVYREFIPTKFHKCMFISTQISCCLLKVTLITNSPQAKANHISLNGKIVTQVNSQQ